MKTLKIDDLETSKALDEASMKRISGGFGFANGSLMAPVTATGPGFGFASPQTVVSVPVYVPVNVAIDLDTDLGIDTKLANVIGSATSLVAQ